MINTNTMHTVPHGSTRILATRSAATKSGMIFMDFKFSF